MNYLIGRVASSSSDAKAQKASYKCLAYTESASSSFHSIGNEPQASKHTRRQHIDLADFAGASEHLLVEPSHIQLSVSSDEFCRSIDNMIDEQASFSFSKVQDSLHASPASLKTLTPLHKRKFRRHVTTTTANNASSYALPTLLFAKNKSSSKPSGATYHHACKFPRWLNKKWHNLKQTKMFTVDYRLDSLLVLDQKSSVIINKYTCTHMRSRKANHVQAVVKSLNGW